MSSRLEDLKERMAYLADLRHVASLAHWDQQTMMPSRGGLARAESLATLERISHEMFVDDETGRLIDDAATELNGADPSSDEYCLVRLVRRQWDKARRVPTELAAEITRAASVGQEAWIIARRDSDFASFAPYLKNNFELARRYVECHAGTNGYECAYDVVLDDFEPEMKTTEVSRLFAELRDELVPMIARLKEEGHRIDDSPLHGHFPESEQRPLIAEAIALMGFERTGWRLDDTVHPFAMKVGGGDVRITTRWDESYFPSGAVRRDARVRSRPV